jgi:hypothetical protein
MLILDELLEVKNFKESVNNLAAGFRKEHNLPQIHQLGLVVSDVEAAAEKLEKMGIGPFFISSGSLARWDERDKPRRFRAKVGIATHKGVDLELLEPGEGSDFYRQHLDPDGRIVVQHLGCHVKNVDKEMEKLNAAGYSTWVRGRIKSWPTDIEFAYMDTLSEAQTIIEMIGFHMMGLRFKPPGFAYHFLGRLEKLSGFRCIDVG